MLIYDALLFKSDSYFVPHQESVQCTCFYMVIIQFSPSPPQHKLGCLLPGFGT